VRPLAYLDNERVVCASCAGAVSIFACRQCGREDNLYGATRCARCILRERLTALLTDPATGQVHVRLRAVLDELVGSDRPQAGIWWLRKQPGIGPRLLAQMAAGQIEISHDTFRALPSDRAHDYLRTLLTAVGVLAPFEIRIERMLPFLDGVVVELPAEQAALVRRFAHWHVLPQMRTAAREQRLTQTMANAARRRIRVAIDFLAFLDANDATATGATQGMLERYQVANPSNRSYVHAFLVWLRDSRINTGLHIPWVPHPAPAVTVSEARISLM